MRYQLWEVKVQIYKVPCSYEKVRLLAELDQATANAVHEKGLKHPYISGNVMWLCINDEIKYGVPARTFCLLENYQWRKV